MRFLFLSGSTSVHSGSSALGLRSTGSGHTRGLLGKLSLAGCPLPSMLSASNGTLLIATGYGPMQRMRQNERRLSTAGVPAPRQPLILSVEGASDSIPLTRLQHFDYSQYGTAVTFSAISSTGTSGQFTLSGQSLLSFNARYADYTTYLPLAVVLPNEEASLTSQSPIPLDTIRRVQDLFIGYNFTFPRVWHNTVFDLLINNHTVNPVNGRYQAWMRYVDKDGNFSNPGPISADAVIDNSPFIKYTNIEAVTDQRIARRQIFRNTDGQSDIFYLDIDSDDLGATEYTSYLSDDQLKLQLAQPMFDNDGFSLAYLYSEPPTDKPFIAEFNTRIWAVGTVNYKTGHLEVTNGSTTITGIGTSFNVSMVGWQLAAFRSTYAVLAVDATAQTLTIDRPYEGPSDNYVLYSLQPYRANQNLIYFSLAGYPEAWPIENVFGLPQDEDEVTGIINFSDALYILKQRHIYHIAQGADPLRDAEIKPFATRGCINQRCAVAVDHHDCFMLDRQGIHKFTPHVHVVYTQDQPISLPIADIFREDGEWLRLNWDADTCYWHGIRIEELSIIRWYVALEGHRYPKHAICYDYVRNRWWVEEYPVAITSSCLSKAIIGRPILGTDDGRIITCDEGTLDLIGSTTINNRVGISSVPSDYTAVATADPGTGTGLPIAVVDGPGRGQMRTIVAINSGFEIEIDQAWTVLPTTDSILQIGAIPYYAQSGDFNLLKLEMESSQGLILKYSSTYARIGMYLSIVRNGGPLRENTVSTTWGALSSDPNDKYVKRIDLSNDLEYAGDNFDLAIDRDTPAKYTTGFILQGHSGPEIVKLTEAYVTGSSSEVGVG